ncbi:MAG: ribosome maturation factor RimM [Armatimonadetes bacterium]|nr:ribosome maturation factor RimM [Armatimonadota bacterium]
MASDEWNVLIGEVVAPFGRRGEVKVLPYTDYPEHFFELKEVRPDRAIEGQNLKIEAVRQHKNLLLVKFEGFNDISAAERLRGAKLYIREKDLVPLGKDEYYIHDIIGLEVVTPEGKSLGKVKEVIRGPANDVYVTERAMIPAVKEFVTSIDLREKRIVVRPIPGMVEENENES